MLVWNLWLALANIVLNKLQEHNGLFFSSLLIITVWAGSSVGIATDYGLDGPRIESRWGARFSARPDRPWGPPSLLYNGYRVFSGGKVRPGVLLTTLPPPL